MKAKPFYQTLLMLSLFLVISMSSCKKDKCEQTITYKTFEPVYMSYEELRAAVKTESPQPLKNPGKIYILGNYLFVNEIDKGIHVFDNTNPSSPQNISFIKIPGNLDMSAIGNALYADSYVDLVTLDISNPQNVTVLNRVNDAVPYRYYTNGGVADATKGVVTEWKEVMKTEKISTNCTPGGGYYRGPYMFEGDVKGGVMANSTSGTTSPTTVSQQPGVGGSTARFTISHNTLYIVDYSSLHIYDISNTANPAKVADKNLGWSIETIFPYKNRLFIGSSSGVYIYDITNPLSPTQTSVYSHITACDPVVVADEYAYFTLSNDAPCHMGVNQLEIVDITNLSAPTLKITVPMTNPKGVGIDNKKLFVCDGNDGLKVYDASDVMQIGSRMIAHFSNINSFDVIPFNNDLIMVGSDGLYQYDYSNVQNISLLSRIPVEK